MLDLLAGVKVIDLTSIILGPMAGQVLGDYGAHVVKIESPSGDLARLMAPHGPDGTGAMYVNNNRNKHSLVLDLKKPSGRTVLERLVAQSDVFLHNMRLDPLARLGFDAARCLEINPRLVHCGAVGYGSNGPNAGRPAYDDVIQAASGLAGLFREVGQDPSYVPSVVTDKITALYVVQAILTALFHRERTGRGQAVEVPMFEAMASFVLNEHLAAATFSAEAAPGYQRLTSADRKPFRTTDGWIAVLPYNERHWRKVLAEIGREDVLEEPWFADDRQRSRNVTTLYRVLGDAMATRGTDAWLEVFARLDVPHSRVASLDDLLTDEHLDAVGFFRPTDDAPGRVRSVAQPVRFEGAKDLPDRAAPARGADTDGVLGELGFGADEIAALRGAGAFGEQEAA